MLLRSISALGSLRSVSVQHLFQSFNNLLNINPMFFAKITGLKADEISI